MKKGAVTDILKQIICVVTSLVKAKSLALKNKTSAIKTRLLVFSLLRNKKLLFNSISHKLHALLRHDHDNKNSDHDQTQALVLLCTANSNSNSNSQLVEEEKDFAEDEKYPDLTHSLFHSEELEFEDPGGSVIDIVKNSKESGGGEFKLEDEIDEVADLFIRRFHRQMRIQKQLSFKRYQDMLQRSV